MNSESPLVAPIFPLPNVVFFPQTYLPLHVFEPRYRAMMEDAIAGARLVVMVLARETRPAAEVPAVYPIGSMGRIEVAEPLEEGRFHVVLRGLARVSLGRLIAAPIEQGYFSAEIEVLVDALPDLQDPRVAERKARFLLTARKYGEQVLGGQLPDDLLGDAVPYATLVNRMASALRVGVREKQALLTLDDLDERAAEVERWMHEQIQSHAAIDRFFPRRPADPRAN